MTKILFSKDWVSSYRVCDQPLQGLPQMRRAASSEVTLFTKQLTSDNWARQKYEGTAISDWPGPNLMGKIHCRHSHQVGKDFHWSWDSFSANPAVAPPYTDVEVYKLFLLTTISVLASRETNMQVAAQLTVGRSPFKIVYFYNWEIRVAGLMWVSF